MDFRNKYLKYKPEITFDIFQEVWDKLIESGYLPVGKYDVERGFGDFKTLHCYLRTTETHPMEFNCYSVIPALFWVETTVQEILGYDPFVMDDDFVLPERWCIKIPKFKDAPKEIIDWRVDVKNRGTWVSAGYLDNSGWHSDNITDGYTEISFDQFKKHVLKQDVEENIKINYYKCIKSDFPELVLGKLYPSHDGKLVKIPHGEYTSCFYVNDGGRFELSNKSAFDAQNQPKQPQKQAVHCETQEQWDFVTEKLGYEWNVADWTDYGNNTCVNLEYKGFGTAAVAYNGYQILSFSDWCAQNNYEFQSKATSLKNMFDFNVSEQTANNISETIDRVRYMAMQTAQADMLEDALKSFTCDIQHYDHEFLAQMLGGKVSKVNKVQISTDNEIKINIIQKQSIKI